MKVGDEVVISVLDAFGIPLPKQQRSLDTYHRIFEAAQQCVAELGYSKTSTQEVATRAGISQGGLFKRFPTKISLMASMVGYLEAKARRFAAEKFSLELLAAPVRDRVRYFITGYWAFVQTDEFKAIDDVWESSRTDSHLLEALRPIMASDVTAGDLATYFPELKGSIPVQFISQVIYASLEYLSFNHGIGVDDHAAEKLDVLTDMVCRQIEVLLEKQLGPDLP